jgi:hypothetical protein
MENVSLLITIDLQHVVISPLCYARCVIVSTSDVHLEGPVFATLRSTEDLLLSYAFSSIKSL